MIAAVVWAALGVGAWSHSAQARAVPRLAELLRSQLASVPEAVNACLLEEDGPEAWEVTDFLLTVSPYVTVGIPFVLQLEVNPQFTFVWSHDPD